MICMPFKWNYRCAPLPQNIFVEDKEHIFLEFLKTMLSYKDLHEYKIKEII